jgi:hypothetical protein
MKRVLEAEAQPLRGGAVTVREPALLPFGTFSMVQNMRPERPGFKKRPGQSAQHTTADGTNQVLNIYQFRKGKVDENHLFGQFGDGDILEATNMPPTTTTGAFGSEVFSGNASPDPASFCNVSDVLIMSTGVDQHKIYGGESSYVTKFIVFKGAADPKDVPELGLDYSDEVTDGQSTTVAVLDDLNTWANWDCLFICTPVPADALGITIAAGNDNASTLTLYYRKSDNTWADTSATDGTKTGSDCLYATGNITWTAPSDEIPVYMFGIHGYWYQIRVSAALDSDVEVSGVTFQSPWSDAVNLWDAVPVDAIETFVETGVDSGKYYNYGSTAVDIGDLPSGADIMVPSYDPIEGIYVDVGSVPHTGTAITFTINYWNGSAWTSVGTVNDSTDGLFHSGWLRFPRQSAAQPLMFQGTNYYAYWYQIVTGAAAATTSMNVGIQVMPYYNIDDFGVFGQTNACWREHACYTFTSYPEYVYMAMTDQPLVLNGTEFGILEAGDGRSNRVLCMKPLFNNLLVWQEEKGVEGGCTTIFQGYDPTTYGKLIISTHVGIVNSKAAVVVEGVQTSAQSQEKFGSSDDIAKGTYAFWISRYGVMCTDGRTIWVISDDIQDYFDPTKTATCLRRGYEKEHWIAFDYTYNILRIGLVCGTSATKPNIFPVFDLTDKVWYFDSLQQPLSCVVEIESGSGNLPITQLGGGTADGTVYITNTGQLDVSTAINSYIDIVINHKAMWLVIDECLFRCKTQAAGNVTITTYENEVQKDSFTKSMVAEVTNDSTRRHRFNLNVQGSLCKVRFQHNTASQDMDLQDVGFGVQVQEGR